MMAEFNNMNRTMRIPTASCLKSSFPDFASCLYLWPSEPKHSTTFGAFTPFITLHVTNRN